MKKVILDSVEKTSIDSITEHSIVGLKCEGEYKIYLISLDSKIIGLNIYHRNLYERWRADTKREYAYEFIKEHNAEVFVFDSEEEIINWLKS